MSYNLNRLYKKNMLEEAGQRNQVLSRILSVIVAYNGE